MNAKKARALTESSDLRKYYKAIKQVANKGGCSLYLTKYELSQSQIDKLRKNEYTVSAVYNDSGYENRVVGYNISW